jgi:hypothetical protein
MPDPMVWELMANISPVSKLPLTSANELGDVFGIVTDPSDLIK